MDITKLNDEELLKIVKPIAEHTENAWNEKSYEGFCKYLLKAAPGQLIPEEVFNHQLENEYDRYGLHTIADLVAIHRNPDNVVVMWKVNFEKRPEPGLLMYCFIQYEDEVLIDGCIYQA
ncbi:hypothetical protein ACFOEK_14715 [Litoribrevibacter euphylliae]|uniref:Nuclear transport factor 2 family protein n=1 Tax=Litoribrevibacter euphylliae TaxID=1834034 RepID=A0ABV7HJF6_9GAMM